MRVVEGSSLELGDNSWVKPEVEMDERDFLQAMAEWGVSAEKAASIPLFLKYEVLSVLARLLIANRLVEATKNDARNEGWLRTVGKPTLQAVAEEMKTVFGKVKATVQ